MTFDSTIELTCSFLFLLFYIIKISKPSFAIIWNFKDMPILTYLLTQKTRTCQQNPVNSK